MKTRTLNDHLLFAENLKKIEQELNDLISIMLIKFPSNHKVYRLLQKIQPTNIAGIWNELKSELDNDYHSIISDEDFLKHSHIYYKK